MKVKFDDLAELIGRSVDDAVLMGAMSELGVKPPKKLEISARASDRSYSFESKSGVDFYFTIELRSAKFKPKPAQKKGVFYPVLTQISFGADVVDGLPLGLSFDLKFDELTQILGAPTLKSSDISPIWLKADGSESFYRWEINLNGTGKVLQIELDTEQNAISNLALKVRESCVLFSFYDELAGENFDSYKANLNNRDHANLMLICYMAENGMLECSNLAAKFDPLDYVKALDQGYFSTDELTRGAQKVRKYLLNLNGDGSYFYGDFVRAMLGKRENYLGAAVQSELDAIEYGESEYKLIKELLDAKFR